MNFEYYTPRDKFIEIWNGAVDLAEVAHLTSCQKRSCTLRAQRLRAMGYLLKPFKRGPKRKYGGGTTHARIGH